MSPCVWPTQVRWGMAGKACSVLMRVTASRVRSRLLPSAP